MPVLLKQDRDDLRATLTKAAQAAKRACELVLPLMAVGDAEAAGAKARRLALARDAKKMLASMEGVLGARNAALADCALLDAALRAQELPAGGAGEGGAGFAALLQAKRAARPAAERDPASRKALLKSAATDDMAKLLLDDASKAVKAAEALAKGDGEVLEAMDSGGEEGGDAEGLRFKCPVTRLLMEDPRRNTVCGHRFSKRAADFLLAKPAATCICPVAGCSKPFTAADLLADADFAEEVGAFKQKAEAARRKADSGGAGAGAGAGGSRRKSLHVEGDDDEEEEG
jgi:hypothetical protein